MLIRRTAREGDVVLTATLPNARLVGVTAVATMPVPKRLAVTLLVASVTSVTVSVPDRLWRAVGAKRTSTSQEPRAGTTPAHRISAVKSPATDRVTLRTDVVGLTIVIVFGGLTVPTLCCPNDCPDGRSVNVAANTSTAQSSTIATTAIA